MAGMKQKHIINMVNIESNVRIKLNTIDSVKDFVDICSSYGDSNIDVTQGRYVINGKSILGMFSLNLTEPIDIFIDSQSDHTKISFYKEIQKWRINNSV